MKVLFVLNDPPYGSERSYNGFRLAITMTKENPKVEAMVFLMGDAVTCAVQGQKTPEGYYNIERMVRALITKKAEVKCCGTCLDARGLQDSFLISGVKRGTMDELSQWVAESDRVLIF